MPKFLKDEKIVATKLFKIKIYNLVFKLWFTEKRTQGRVYVYVWVCVCVRERERVQGWQQYEREIFGIRAINSPPPNNINPLLSYYIVNNAEVKRKTRWGFWHLTLPFVCQRKEWIEQKKFDNWNIFQCNKTWLLQIEVLR